MLLIPGHRSANVFDIANVRVVAWVVFSDIAVRHCRSEVFDNANVDAETVALGQP